mmetsp:Transcript_14633/g.61819  ORF Transcript_14633/g.61819 Transcript_14633/m.61819 type:complete len:284 (+) Transcript_14633:405-1256(+)
MQIHEVVGGDEFELGRALLAGPAQVLPPVASQVPRPTCERARQAGTPVHGIHASRVANKRLKHALRRSRRRRELKRVLRRRDRVARGEHGELGVLVVVETCEGSVPHGVAELGRIVRIGAGSVHPGDPKRHPHVAPIFGVKDVKEEVLNPLQVLVLAEQRRGRPRDDEGVGDDRRGYHRAEDPGRDDRPLATYDKAPQPRRRRGGFGANRRVQVCARTRHLLFYVQNRRIAAILRFGGRRREKSVVVDPNFGPVRLVVVIRFTLHGLELHLAAARLRIPGVQP